MVGHQVILPEGYRDAKLGVIIAATIGEMVQGDAWPGFAWQPREEQALCHLHAAID